MLEHFLSQCFSVFVPFLLFQFFCLADSLQVLKSWYSRWLEAGNGWRKNLGTFGSSLNKFESFKLCSAVSLNKCFSYAWIKMNTKSHCWNKIFRKRKAFFKMDFLFFFLTFRCSAFLLFFSAFAKVSFKPLPPTNVKMPFLE